MLLARVVRLRFAEGAARLLRPGNCSDIVPPPPRSMDRPGTPDRLASDLLPPDLILLSSELETAELRATAMEKAAATFYTIPIPTTYA